MRRDRPDHERPWQQSPDYRALPPLRLAGIVLCPTCHHRGMMARTPEYASVFHCVNRECSEHGAPWCRRCGGYRRVGADGLFVCESGPQHRRKACDEWREIVPFCPTCGVVGSRTQFKTIPQWCANLRCPDYHFPTLMSNELNSVPMVRGTESEALYTELEWGRKQASSEFIERLQLRAHSG